MKKIKAALTFVWLTLVALYFLSAFYNTLTEGNWPVRRWTGNIFWPAKWKMFTFAADNHHELIFEGWINGKWRRLEMEKWYPFQWENGYRWERPAVYNYRSRQIPFLVAACQKSNAQKVRLVKKSWKKNSKNASPSRKALSSWNCSEMPPPFQGRIL